MNDNTRNFKPALFRWGRREAGGLFLLLFLLLAGCRDGRIPCPDLGGKKLTLFKKKSPAGPGRETAQGQNVNFGKNGLIKKKNYKYLRNKPNRKKYR